MVPVSGFFECCQYNLQIFYHNIRFFVAILNIPDKFDFNVFKCLLPIELYPKCFALLFCFFFQ